MTIGETVASYHGKPVIEFRMGDQVKDRSTVRTHAFRLAQDYESEESQSELLDAFLAQIDPRDLETLIIGAWSEAHESGPDEILEQLIHRRADLPNLRHLFVGDITYEECEISWIIQSDYNPILEAFPGLQSLRIRGSTDLGLGAFEHASLQELAIECGGLPSRIVGAIAGSSLPALKRLELWLGDANYGFDGELVDYVSLLQRIDASRLSYLGLRNAQNSDELAQYLAGQSWINRLHTLDLSMGTIGDDGAKAWCESPHLKGLSVLDLSHHYISESWQTKLRALPCKVVLDDPQDAGETDGDRYVQVSE